MAKLTDKQRAFVDEYLVDLNATQAAIRAGYSKKTANRIAEQNLSKLDIQQKIRERMKEREARTEITQDKVLNELAQIAFANGSDFAKVVEKPVLLEDGSIMVDPITGNEMYYKTVDMELTDNLPKEKKKAISNIKMGKHGIEVGTCDKVRALELLGRHLGMWNDKIEVKADVKTSNPYDELTVEELKALAKQCGGEYE